MTRQTWTAALSAVLFVASAAIVALVPVPFVTFAPGTTQDLLGAVDTTPVVAVEGAQTYPTNGRLLVPTVDYTRASDVVTLPEAMYAHWAPYREAFPREAIYGSAQSPEEFRQNLAQLVAASQLNASAAGLRAAGFDVQQVPMVQSIASAGPAVDRMQQGDFILAVDGVATPTVADVRQLVERREVGDPVTFTVLRARERLDVTIDTAPSNTRAGVPVWGGTLTMGYSYAPRVTFSVDAGQVGGDAGLMTALAVFDRVTAGDLVGDRVVAGTGEIDGAGAVSNVWGLRERMAAAESAGAGVFLVPTANCADTVGVATRMRVVPVGSLDEAIAALDALGDPGTADLVKGCQ